MRYRIYFTLEIGGDSIVGLVFEKSRGVVPPPPRNAAKKRGMFESPVVWVIEIVYRFGFRACREDYEDREGCATLGLGSELFKVTRIPDGAFREATY